MKRVRITPVPGTHASSASKAAANLSAPTKGTRDTDDNLHNPALLRGRKRSRHASQKSDEGQGTVHKISHTAHPALVALAHLLGRQAAAHVQKHRFEGLGRLQLIMHHIKSIEQI